MGQGIGLCVCGLEGRIRLCVCSLRAGFQFPINPKHQHDTTSRAIKNVGKKVRWILQSQICQGFYFGFVTTFINGQAKNLFVVPKKGGKLNWVDSFFTVWLRQNSLPHRLRAQLSSG
jgi:hypothetical protein